ncbi:serine hydrolase [Cellulophaga tyrosinoxydans]|uniref:Beta-lactamase enzyme family protein n=1 Tax=Cellulophaga tyrosinoxydans TaxID=504486 RepID=A0A1W2C1E0_9FLAO|nr:serine hydrolase [Cellulophaga tyrosinoxydans]SMC78960.1 Beta-lactamase enzyme family protein [Cellulophaga tyrosinoxydans]
MQIKHTFYIFFLLTLFSCKEEVKITAPLADALASQSPKIKMVMDSLEHYEVQIKFTQIDRNNTKEVVFTDYKFQVNANNYFYPASTVKLPIAVLALEKLNSLENLDMNSVFYIEGDTLETTFAKEISKIFAISDNEAYNRLFEFLGQDEINQKLTEKGINNARISHRVSSPNADNITTKPLIIYINDSTIRVTDRIINKPIKPLNLQGIKKGTGFYEEDILINKPFDFSLKNYYAIDAQHEVLKRIIFPESFEPSQQFNITETQRAFLLNTMHSLPRELGYTANEYYDSYVKFFMYGDSHESIPENIKIYNKVGYAHGTLTDCAYIKDTLNNIEFLLTATILVNKNGIFNDDTYEFDSIGIPFLAQLGRELYQQELGRKKIK